jgi:hypothetical protein
MNIIEDTGGDEAVYEEVVIPKIKYNIKALNDYRDDLFSKIIYNTSIDDDYNPMSDLKSIEQIQKLIKGFTDDCELKVIDYINAFCTESELKSVINGDSKLRKEYNLLLKSNSIKDLENTSKSKLKAAIHKRALVDGDTDLLKLFGQLYLGHKELNNPKEAGSSVRIFLPDNGRDDVKPEVYIDEEEVNEFKD